MKNKMNGLKLVLVAMFFATSCVLEKSSSLDQEAKETQLEDGYVMLKVNVGNNDAQSLLTKASDANVVNVSELDIQKIRLYVFNGTTFESTKLFTGSQITKTGEQYSVNMPVKEGTNKTIYAIINETTGTTAPTTNVTIDQLNKLSFTLQNYFPSSIGGNVEKGIFVNDGSTPKYTLPAAGVSSTFSVVSTITQSITINLKRSVARVDIYINKKAELPLFRFDATRNPASRLIVWQYKTGLFLQTSTEANAANVETFQGGGKTFKISYPNGTSASTAASEWVKVCHFYTPSRKAATNEVTRDFFGINLSTQYAMSKSGTTEEVLYFRSYNLPNLLDKVPNKTFEMNKIYKLYCTLNYGDGEPEIVVKYVDWGVWTGKYDI